MIYSINKFIYSFKIAKIFSLIDLLIFIFLNLLFFFLFELFKYSSKPVQLIKSSFMAYLILTSIIFVYSFLIQSGQGKTTHFTLFHFNEYLFILILI